MDGAGALALFGRSRRTVEDVIRQANSAFEGYSVGGDWHETMLKPALLELYRALSMRMFTSVDQLEAIAAPLRTMPPLNAALCAGSALHTAGRQLAAEHLGESMTNFIAATGMGAMWKVVETVDDEQSIRNLIASMDVLWRFEPSPYREVDHAQTVYVSGHLSRRLGLDRDALMSRWRQALLLLAQVDPGLAGNETEREKVVRTMERLEREWREQLASMDAEI